MSSCDTSLHGTYKGLNVNFVNTDTQCDLEDVNSSVSLNPIQTDTPWNIGCLNPIQTDTQWNLECMLIIKHRHAVLSRVFKTKKTQLPIHVYSLGSFCGTNQVQTLKTLSQKSVCTVTPSVIFCANKDSVTPSVTFCANKLRTQSHHLSHFVQTRTQSHHLSHFVQTS